MSINTIREIPNKVRDPFDPPRLEMQRWHETKEDHRLGSHVSELAIFGNLSSGLTFVENV